MAKKAGVITVKDFYDALAKNDTPIGVIADLKAIVEPEED